MTPKPKPVNCACGRKATVASVYGPYQVECHNTKCWIGPQRKTLAAAVKVWDKVMGKEAS